MRDRTRFEHGRRCLTLRMIWVRIKYLPLESALVNELADGPVWCFSDYLLDDIRMAMSGGEPHPTRPQAGAKKRLDPVRIAEGQQRRAERKRAIEAGEIT